MLSETCHFRYVIYCLYLSQIHVNIITPKSYSLLTGTSHSVRYTQKTDSLSWKSLAHEMKKKMGKYDQRLETVICLCMQGRGGGTLWQSKKSSNALVMLFKAHLSSIWRIFFSEIGKKNSSSDDDNGPHVHTTINNET